MGTCQGGVSGGPVQPKLSGDNLPGGGTHNSGIYFSIIERVRIPRDGRGPLAPKDAALYARLTTASSGARDFAPPPSARQFHYGLV